MAFGYKKELDLIQNMRQMTLLAAELETKFAEVEPSMEIIFQLRDDFQDLESRTITIVNNFETQIQQTESEASKIIDDLNAEVERIRANIDELLNLSDNFDSIAESIEALLAMKDVVDDLVVKVNNMATESIIVIPEGEDIPVEDRKEGMLYFKATDELLAGLKDGTVIYVSPQLAMRVE